MRTALAATVTLALVFGATSSGASAATPRWKHCPPKQAHRVTADTGAEVFLGPELVEGELFPEVQIYYGCAFNHHRSYELGIPFSGSETGGSSTGMFRLAGPIVAYETSSTTEMFPGARYEDWIIVRNLATGRVLHKLPTGTEAAAKNRNVGIGPAYAIVLNSRGSVAWIAGTKSVAGTPGQYQVHAFDRTGARTLAVGADIAPTSLALAGSTLYWTQGGEPFSAPLN